MHLYLVLCEFTTAPHTPADQSKYHLLRYCPICYLKCLPFIFCFSAEELVICSYMYPRWLEPWLAQIDLCKCVSNEWMDELLDNHNIQNNIGLVIFETLQAENESKGLLGHSYWRDFRHFSYVAYFEITSARVSFVTRNWGRSWPVKNWAWFKPAIYGLYLPLQTTLCELYVCRMMSSTNLESTFPPKVYSASPGLLQSYSSI